MADPGPPPRPASNTGGSSRLVSLDRLAFLQKHRPEFFTSRLPAQFRANKVAGTEAGPPSGATDDVASNARGSAARSSLLAAGFSPSVSSTDSGVAHSTATPNNGSTAVTSPAASTLPTKRAPAQPQGSIQATRVVVEEGQKTGTTMTMGESAKEPKGKGKAAEEARLDEDDDMSMEIESSSEAGGDPVRVSESAAAPNRKEREAEATPASNADPSRLPKPRTADPASLATTSIRPSLLDEFEQRRYARMDKLEAERVREIEELKKGLVKRDAERETLQSQITELKSDMARIEGTIAKESQAATTRFVEKEWAEYKSRFDTLFAVKVDERIKLSRKSLVESVSSKFEADTTTKVKELTTHFEGRVKDIELGFVEWWSEKQKELDVWALDQAAQLKTEVLASSTTPRTSTGVGPPRAGSDPRRTNPVLVQPSTSRLPPAAPPARLPASSLAKTSSSRPQSPSEPLRSPVTASSDHVTPSQLVASRTKCVNEIKEMDKKVDKQFKKFNDKLNRLAALVDTGGGGGGGGSGANSPLVGGQSPSQSQAKKPRPTEEQDTTDPVGSGGERPRKRVRQDDEAMSSSLADLTDQVEAARREAKVAKDAVERIVKLETAVTVLQTSLRTELREMANCVSEVEEELDKVRDSVTKTGADNEETLKRMADGDKRVARVAQFELNKVRERIETQVTDLKRIETDLGDEIKRVGKEYKSVETWSTEQMETVFGRISTVESSCDQIGKEKEDLKKKLYGITADWRLLKAEVMETTGHQRADRISHAKQLREVQNTLEAKVDLTEFTRRLETKIEQSVFDERLESKSKDLLDTVEDKLSTKVEQTVYQRGIDDLNEMLSNPQPINPKDVLPLLDQVLTERSLNQVVADIDFIRATVENLNQFVLKVEKDQNQALDVCHLTLRDIKQEVLETAQSVETVAESVTTATTGSEHDARGVALAETIASIAQFKADLERLQTSVETMESRPDPTSPIAKLNEEVERIANGPKELEVEVKDLRSKVESNERALEALRSKPTSPLSPVFPASSSNVHGNRPTSPSALDLDARQKAELLATLLRSVEEALSTTDSLLHKKIEDLISPTKTMQVQLDRLEQQLRIVQRLGENTDDSLRDYKKRFGNTSTVDCSPRVKKLEDLWQQLCPAIAWIHARLDAILQEAGTVVQDRHAQALNQAHANFPAPAQLQQVQQYTSTQQQQAHQQQQARQQQQIHQQQPLQRSRGPRHSDGGAQRPNSANGASQQAFVNAHLPPQPFQQSNATMGYVHEAPTYPR